MDKENEIGGTSGWPFERVCPVCGEVFSGTLLEAWTYKDRGELLCSWGCQRQREKRRAEEEQKEAAKKRRAKRLKPSQKEGLIKRYVYQGLSNEEISTKTGMSAQLVNYYRRKIEEEDPRDD